jgi:hypothetical protein
MLFGDNLMKLLRLMVLATVLLMATACGSVAAPVWQGTATPRFADFTPQAVAIQPTATAVPATPTDVPPTAAPTEVPPTLAPTDIPPTLAPTTEATQDTQAAAPTVAGAGNEWALLLPAVPNSSDPLPDTAAQEELMFAVLLSTDEDRVSGERLFNRFEDSLGYACSTCHSIEEGVRLIGPSMWGLPARAAVRVPNMNVETYVYNSILHPLDYIVPGWVPETAIMPQTYAQIYTQDEVYDLMAYVLSISG